MIFMETQAPPQQSECLSLEIQAELFQSGAELLTVDEDAKTGRYSGVIIDKNRAKVRAICAALAEGIGVQRIARAFAVSTHTVLAMRERHPELIAIEKKQLSGQVGRILKLSADRFEAALINGEVSPALLPVAFGIFTDKQAQLEAALSGSVAVDSVQPGVSVEAVKAMLEEMKFRAAKSVSVVAEESLKGVITASREGVV